MIPVAELDKIAQARLDDAKALLAANRYDGAIYLCGYAVEVALKARTCRVLSWPGFPSTGGEFQPYKSFQTHDLDVLLSLSGQEARIKQQHFAAWSTVAVWKSESRYTIVGTAQQTDATAMLQAAEQLLKVL
jgi:HEPN domain-containing protein